MTAHADETNGFSETTRKQYLFIIRHGDRWDYAHPDWKKTAERFGDPPLSNLGQQQARETGLYLDSIISKHGLKASKIKVLCSPFLRCIQTCDGILSQFKKTMGDASENVMICPEKSVWEIDGGHNGTLHACLPTLEERKCYFPRLDITHESLFAPSLPETKTKFLTRCEKAMVEFNKKHPFVPDTVFIIVTHAAGCVSLSKAAGRCELSDINPACPCGVFGLTRSSNTEKWDIDHFAKEGGLNGHSKHLTDIGVHTVSWNHLGPGGSYSGPPQE